jgi:hypothetical protein
MIADAPPADSRGTDATAAEELIESGIRDAEAIIRAEHASYARGYAEGVADAEARFSERHSFPEHRAILDAARRQGFADAVRPRWRAGMRQSGAPAGSRSVGAL